MQPTTNDESSTSGSSGRTQPTKAQEDYARGFTDALDRLYEERGAPVVVRGRSLSTPSDVDQTAPSNCASLPPPAALPTRSTAGSSAVQSTGRCLPDAVTTSADRQEPVRTTIPLCVALLAYSDVDSHPHDTDEPQQQQPTSDGNSSAAEACSTPVVEQQSAAAATEDAAAPVNDKRRRNRSAARRCREKRLDRQRTMRQQVDDIGAENRRLETKIARLRDRLEQLQRLLAEHRLGQYCHLAAGGSSSADATAMIDELRMINDDLSH